MTIGASACDRNTTTAMTRPFHQKPKPRPSLSLSTSPSVSSSSSSSACPWERSKRKFCGKFLVSLLCSLCFLLSGWNIVWKEQHLRHLLPRGETWGPPHPETFLSDNHLLIDAGNDNGNSNDDSHKKKPTPTHTACDGYNGIYHVAFGDIGGAAGTIFFQFVVGQIIWAEMYNFKPWVHLNNISYIVYDHPVHGRPQDSVEFDMMTGLNISYVRRRPSLAARKDAVPGPPLWNESTLQPHHFHFVGNGVWDSYFEPVSDFVPGDVSCTNKPLVSMDMYLVTPGIHGFASWAPRCWRYDYMPDYMTLPHIPLHTWLEPQRYKAHAIVTKYIRFKPFLHAMAQRVNPTTTTSSKCCGVHIRHSDKQGGRRQVAMDEFLPYLEAYVAAGGTCIYLATDSTQVLQTAHTAWPPHIATKLRSLGANVVRSHNTTAVFDMASHHRTNTEILVEILALSYCDFLLHGLSAVTETAIWIHVQLHHQSVNLEDPDHMSVTDFQHLVHAVVSTGTAPPVPPKPTPWWEQPLRLKPSSLPTVSSSSSMECPAATSDLRGYRGILHIQFAGQRAAAGTAFFTTILNQLDYADRYQLKPWIHLDEQSQPIYDQLVHGNVSLQDAVPVSQFTFPIGRILPHYHDSAMYPGPPADDVSASVERPMRRAVSIHGTGVWNHYFHPVSDFLPQLAECYLNATQQSLVMYRLDNTMVMPGLHSYAPSALRAWRYDNVSADLWNPDNKSLVEWYYPMRRRAHALIQKYYRFQPHIIAKAQQVNPVDPHSPCLAIHIRQSDKEGLHRSRFPPRRFRDYAKAFVAAGGKSIYVATDSSRVLEYMQAHFPSAVLNAVRNQGTTNVVRSSKKLSVFDLADHHRTNSEALVDVLAMSQCQLLLHGYSAMSEAAIYLNLNLHQNSVNLEDPNAMSFVEFRELAKSVLKDAAETETNGDSLTHSSAAVATNQDNPTPAKHRKTTTTTGSWKQQHLTNVTETYQPPRHCRQNAIVYLAQKQHSSYDRNSYALLQTSLEKLYQNYLSLHDHADNTDLFIFHSGDFTLQDLEPLADRYGEAWTRLLRLVDLSNTSYWRRPAWHVQDDPNTWYAYHLFKEGYRHMMHWFAIGIWNFFAEYNIETGCNYTMLMRLDEDSLIHSPISYDIFHHMQQKNYVYGYRLCSYELPVTQRVWTSYRAHRPSFQPVRDVTLDLCGFYNNFFVASIDFFQSKQVQAFLKFVDRRGYIYRRRLGDLMIHSMAVYAFAMPQQIYRFLDFTYEHCTVNQTTQCITWGGIQAGYNDDQASATLDSFYNKYIVARPGCTANVSVLPWHDLSPTFSHLSNHVNNTQHDVVAAMGLKTIMAGSVEVAGKGILSG